jgi:hypothetical protein
MADDASRFWHLSDSALLAHFNLNFPQTKPWILLHPQPAMLSALTMALQCKHSDPAQFLPTRDPKTLPGFAGGCDYCEELAVNPMLEDVADPIPFLQVFAERWRNGPIAPRQNTVRSRTVEGTLRAIGQMLASVGAEDIHLTRQGKIHYRIQQQLKGYKCADAPPSRVKPIPFHIIDHTNSVAATCNDPMSLAAADMATIGFFFLLHP